MVVGFNHNFWHKNTLYHIQTEDGGPGNPHIITHLYRGGAILASKKTSYADILQAGNLEKLVEERMKAQHKEMLRRLKNGEIEAAVGEEEGGLGPMPPEPDEPEEIPEPARHAAAAPPPDDAGPCPGDDRWAPQCRLDEIVLAYLGGSQT